MTIQSRNIFKRKRAIITAFQDLKINWQKSLVTFNISIFNDSVETEKQDTLTVTFREADKILSVLGCSNIPLQTYKHKK